jgi:hypothetical protein
MHKPEEQFEEIGKDEMNLAEYPITLLSQRNDSDKKTIEFSDEIKGEGGELVKREWVVTGSDKFGLPVASDNDVLMAIMAVGREHNFDSPKIPFSRYRLMKIMKWEEKGQNYKRIEDGFNRLSGARIYAKNAFWDNENKGYHTVNFGIIDSYDLFESSKKGGRGQQTLPFSYVVLNHRFYQSIKTGYIKNIDTRTYFKLNSAIARRLYRYLDKKRYDGKRKFEINLFTLAEVHVGLQKTKYASHIKEKLEPAHLELIGAGFLKSAEYQKTADKISEKVIYTFGKKTELPAPGQAEQKHPEESLNSELIERLVQLGITRSVAEQILREYSEETVETQIKALKYRKADDPAATLISAIRDNWSLPAAYNSHREKENLRTIDIEQHEQEQQQKAERRGKIQTYICGLSRDELAELTIEAREKAREEGGALFRDREIPQYMVNAYVHMMVEKRLGL